MSHAKRINGVIRMNNDKSSLIHGSVIGNFLHGEMNIPGSERKLDCGWIAFILFARHSKSEIYEARIMRRWFISGHARGKIKIHLASIFGNIAGVGSNTWRILFEEICRLLK